MARERSPPTNACVPGSNPGPGVICGLSLLLVLYSAPRGFCPGTPIFPLSSKTNISKFQFDPGMHGNFWYSVGKQITYLHI